MTQTLPTTSVTDEILATMFLFNIFLALVAACLYFRLVSLVKQGNDAADECRNLIKQIRSLVKKKHAHILETMVWNQEKLDCAYEENLLPAITSLHSELLILQDYERKRQRAAADLKLSTSIDPPTESDDSASLDAMWEVVFETHEVDTSKDSDSDSTRKILVENDDDSSWSL